MTAKGHFFFLIHHFFLYLLVGFNYRKRVSSLFPLFLAVVQSQILILFNSLQYFTISIYFDDQIIPNLIRSPLSWLLCLLTCSEHSLNISLFSGTRYSMLPCTFSYLSSGISHFLKELWFLLQEIAVQKQRSEYYQVCSLLLRSNCFYALLVGRDRKKTYVHTQTINVYIYIYINIYINVHIKHSHTPTSILYLSIHLYLLETASSY